MRDLKAVLKKLVWFKKLLPLMARIWIDKMLREWLDRIEDYLTKKQSNG